VSFAEGKGAILDCQGAQNVGIQQGGRKLVKWQEVVTRELVVGWVLMATHELVGQSLDLKVEEERVRQRGFTELASDYG
jgi:hypothetical protein